MAGGRASGRPFLLTEATASTFRSFRPVMLVALQIALAAVFPLLVVVAALEDLTSFTIPNWISVALTGAFVAMATSSAMPLATFGAHLGVGAAALALGMILFAMGGVGGGDAKLTAAVCLWLGWPATREFLLYMLVAGGVLALMLMITRRDAVRAFLPIRSDWAARLATPGQPAPYAVAIAFGAMAAFPASEAMRAVHLPL